MFFSQLTAFIARRSDGKKAWAAMKVTKEVTGGIANISSTY
jgi:hypothetical protein